MTERKKNWMVLLFLIMLSGFYSIYIGMERDWDMRNYHIYSPWAFLNDRINYDIMPAGIQSYFNPILDVPHFLMIKYLNNSPYLITFLMGIGYALFLFFVYKIAKLVFEKYHGVVLPIFCLFIAVLTFIIARFVGFMSQDLFINALGLCAVYMVLKAINNKSSLKYLSIAGLVIGAATGLKLSASVFAVPLVVSALFFVKSFDKPWKSFFAMIACGAAGFLLFNGFWMYKLYSAYGNPLMPYFNQVFHSPLINPDNVFSIDFYMKNLSKNIYFAFPFYTDWGYWGKVLYFVFFINILTIPFFNKEKFEKTYSINTKYMDFLILFSFFSYLYWVNTLVVLRYILFLAGISSIIISVFLLKFVFIITQTMENWGICKKYVDLPQYVRGFLFAVSLFTMFVVLMPDFDSKHPKPVNRIKLWNGHQFQAIYVQNKNLPDNSVVVTVSGTGILAPFQNPTARYIHLNARTFTQKQIELFTPKQVNKIKNILKNNKDRLYLISDCDVEKYNTTPPSYVEYLIQLISTKRLEYWTMLDKLKIDRNNNNLKIDPKYHWSMLYPQYVAIYELDKYGVDTSKITCEKVRNNLNRTFFLCHLELKR